MNKENLFEVAVREKMRFPYRGTISVEDLWDLNVNSLDTIFQTLNQQLKQVKEESLLNTKTKEDRELDTKIEIIKHIVNVKLDENKEKLAAKEAAEKKKKIMEVLSAKQDEDLQNKSTEELKAMLDQL